MLLRLLLRKLASNAMTESITSKVSNGSLDVSIRRYNFKGAIVLLSNNPVTFIIATLLACVLCRFIYQPLYASPLGQVPGSRLFSVLSGDLHLLIIVGPGQNKFTQCISNTVQPYASAPMKSPSSL